MGIRFLDTVGILYLCMITAGDLSHINYQMLTVEEGCRSENTVAERVTVIDFLADLYKKARKGQIQGMTGIDSAYEPPLSRQFILNLL